MPSVLFSWAKSMWKSSQPLSEVKLPCEPVKPKHIGNCYMYKYKRTHLYINEYVTHTNCTGIYKCMRTCRQLGNTIELRYTYSHEQYIL